MRRAAGQQRRKKRTMAKSFKKAVFAGLILGVLCGLIYWFLTYVPPDIRHETEETDDIVTSLDIRTNEFTSEIQEHRQQVIERTVMIRETIQAEIGALDADGLALAALAEIELWRGSSGDHPPPRPSGVDG